MLRYKVLLSLSLLLLLTIISEYQYLILIFIISGHMYIVPPYCTTNPKDMKTNNSNGNNYTIKLNKKVTNSIPGKPLKLKIRVCDINISLDVLSSNSVQDMKQLIADKTVEMSNSGQKNVPNCIVRRQRIMFMGKELKDNQKLDDLKIDETKIVQVFLRPE